MNNKLIVFDLDGTFYDLKDVEQMNYNFQIQFLSSKKNLSIEEAKIYLSKHHIYPDIRKDSMSATELFQEIGLSKIEWSDFRDARFDVNEIDIEKAENEETIIKFANIGKLSLLSSNAYNVIERILDRLQISTSVFDEIICSDRYPFKTPFKKQNAMEFLSEKYGVEYRNMYSIGDRYNTDIKPILHLGGRGIQKIENKALCKICDDMMADNLKSCTQYIYFDE